MAGYLSTPLWKKLGLNPDIESAAQLLHAPDGWSIAEVPAGVVWLDPADTGECALVVGFYREAARFLGELDAVGTRIRPAGAFWVAWPRKAAGHVSDITENLIRDAALDRGLVDVKVAALDDDWSALKLVWRVENRTAPLE
jgi:hypothetical protein